MLRAPSKQGEELTPAFSRGKRLMAFRIRGNDRTDIGEGHVGELVSGCRHGTKGCCDANPNQKPRSNDTSRIAWAKILARVGEEFPLDCPACGGDIRLIAFITEPGPIRKILTPSARRRLRKCH